MVIARTPEDSPTRCDTCGGECRSGICPRCMLRVAFDPEDGPLPGETPTRIGDYELLEVIAQGGMGVVWRARQTRLRRIVALKLLRESCLPGEEPARRFRIEAEAVALLRHPHIVTVHEVGEIEGRYFFSMELLTGSLADRLLDQPYSPEAAAAMVATVADAVQHAHDRGVLHRDLKPSNILLDEAGEPRVSDFGLARLTADQEHPTLSGALVGTPAYMAPEQAGGLPGEVTTASDVYSLGAVLFEMLTGRVPFEAASHVELMRQVAEESPPRPSSLARGLDRDLETICLKCLEKTPAARYPSARALAEDLSRWRRGEPIHARPVPALERLWKWSRRHKPLSALIVTGVGGLLLVTALSLGFTRRLGREVERTTAAERTVVHRLAAQHGEAAAQLVRRGDWLRALPHLAENCALLDDDPAAARIARVRFETIVRTAPRLSQLWLPEGRLRGIDFDADGQRVAIFADKTAQLFHPTTGEATTAPMVHESDVLHGQLLERSKRLLCQTSKDQWVLWDAVNGLRVAGGEGSIFPLKSAPSVVERGDPRHFVAWYKNVVQPYSLATGEPAGEAMDFGVAVRWAVASRRQNQPGDSDEPALYLICTEDGRLHLCDYTTRKEVAAPIELGKNAALRGYDWNQNVYAIEADEGRVLKFSLLDMATRRITEEARSASSTSRVHGWLGSAQRWCVLVRENYGFSVRDALTENRLIFAQHDSQGYNAAVTLDSKSLVTSSRDGSLRIWGDGGEPATPYLWVGGRPEHLMFDTDGQRLVCASTEPAVRLWERRKDDGAWFTGARSSRAAGAFMAGNELILCRPDGAIERWDLATCAAIGPAANCGHAIRTAVASTQGGIALLTSADSAELWDVKAGQRVGEAIASPGGVRSAALSGDGRIVALLSEKGVCRAGPATGLAALPTMKDSREVALSPDGGSLLLIGNKTTQLWKLPDTLVATLSAAWGGGFSPDGSRFVLWGGPSQREAVEARVFESASGRDMLSPLVHTGDMTSAAFSPDGRFLLSSSRYDARLWDLSTGHLLRALREHPLPPHACGFSPDGAMLWTRTGKELCLWEASTGAMLAPPMPVQGSGSALWSADGRWLSGLDDKQGVRTWNVSPGARSLPEMRALARLLSAHRLTSEGALFPLTQAELREAMDASGFGTAGKSGTPEDSGK